MIRGFFGLVLISFAILFFQAGPASAETGSESAGVSEHRIPWSGYWWPKSNGQLLRGYSALDHAAPLDKYDACEEGFYPGAAARAAADIVYDPSASSWAGFCHSWAAASVLEPEPDKEGDLNGIRFRVGDKKGLLTLYYHENFRSKVYGKRYNGPEDDPDDVYPRDFHQVLRTYINVLDLPVIMDLDPMEPVWNYPAYRYEMNWEDAGSTRQVVCRVWFADDQVTPDFAGTRSFSRTYYYVLEIDENGRVLDSPGQWLGDSIDNHPDFMWFPETFFDESRILSPSRLDAILASEPDRFSEDVFWPNNDQDSAWSLARILNGRYYPGRLHDPDWFRLGAYQGDSIMARFTWDTPEDLRVRFYDDTGRQPGESFINNQDFIDNVSYTGAFYAELSSGYDGEAYSIEFLQKPVTLLSHVALPPNWQTRLTLFNPKSYPISKRLNFFAGQNQLMSRTDIEIPAGSVMQTSAVEESEGIDPGQTGFMRLVSTDPDWKEVSPAMASVCYQAAGQRVDLPLFCASQSGETTLFIPHVELLGRWWNGLVIQNLDPAEDARVDFSFFDPIGRRIYRQEVLIPAGQNRSGLLEQYTDQPVPSSAAWVRIDSDRPVTGLILWGNSLDNDDPGLCGMPLLSARNASQTLYVPHLETRNKWWTGLGIVNFNDTEAAVTFEGGGKSRTIRIPAFGRWCDVVQNAFEQWDDDIYWIKITASQPVAGFQLFGREKSSLAAMGLKSEADLSDKLVVVLPGPQALWAGLTLVNPSDNYNRLTAVAYDADGTRLLPEDQVINGGLIGRGQKRAGLINDFFGQDLPADTAYLIVETSATHDQPKIPITGLGLYEQSQHNGFDRFFVRPLEK